MGTDRPLTPWEEIWQHAPDADDSRLIYDERNQERHGFVPEYEYDPCPDCQGSGHRLSPAVCGRCVGQGWVSQRVVGWVRLSN